MGDFNAMSDTFNKTAKQKGCLETLQTFLLKHYSVTD